MKKNKKNRGKQMTQMDNTQNTMEKTLDSAKIEELIAKIHLCRDEERYEDALETVIQLFEMGYVTQELLIDTGELYFLAGDYQRTLLWANKALGFDAGNAGAAILAARVYALQDDMDKCFEILNGLLAAGRDIAEEHAEKIESLILYFDDNSDFSAALSKYSALGGFMGKGEATAEPIEECAAETAFGASPQSEGAAEESSAAASGADAAEVGRLAADIMAKPVGLTEKIRLFNSFAAAYFYQDDYEAAKTLLLQALAIDERHQATLKNLTVAYLDSGDAEKAALCFSKLEEQDFALLRQIKLG